ncbi:inositol monophosphatase [Adhaeribacter arboris]|uniref:Inositol-1-monophosphatase n=1 Tax=Adhaeribacter arboris TaxID=2072846 RepID=A0A2T2YIA5_9BACT|nr:inositol monophosphatase family protein [Adhaeribacter arboris]PSR55249.1 inositol monophosphatase [Adhaeribacter arboris]
MLLSELCQKVIAITKSTGAFIRTEAQSFDRNRIEHKGLNDLVSYVDKQAEEQLVKGLQQLLPEAGFITEEGTVTEKATEYNWIIDPLDGTTNFIHGLPLFSISIALMQHTEIVLGVVYEINRDECFYATKGNGAFCNDRPIRVSGTEKLADALIVTGYPYTDFGKTDIYLQILKSYMQKSHGVRRLGSAAVDLAYVANGIFEGFFEFNLNSYDVAAGVILVKEAGGYVSMFTDNNGNPVFDREIVASNGQVHAEMLQVIGEYWQG